jgi:hypothetical protein
VNHFRVRHHSARKQECAFSQAPYSVVVGQLPGPLSSELAHTKGT